MNKNITQIARREFASFFSSLTGFIFFGAFLAVTLFVFFWQETFFARNIADVRPMFEWLPVLLIFLVPALTMRMWSEERRAGTLELLLTAPVSNYELVTGKFLACLGLVSVAILLTLPIPLTVSLIGDLDWGPVFGGYVAAVFLAAAYSAIGLFVSARTDNQIVSLLLSTLLCGIFFMIGSDPITGLFDSRIAEVLSLVGSGSRFQSITRGVIDLRDIYYYLSIVGVFLSLNVLGLESMRWSGNPDNKEHKQWHLVTALFVTNFIIGNFWMQQVTWARIDVTSGHIYSISETTRKYLARLKEPLLIRGYFSARTHPLLSPLVPRLRDLLKEYEIAGRGKVKVDFVDPIENQDLEKEASEKYGIKPVVFQSSDKYSASVANSYFDILVKYGDEHVVLTFRDLIDVKMRSETNLNVDLRNPEYDITSAIKKVLYSYQGGGNIFSSISDRVVLKGYVSDDKKLPEPLLVLKQELTRTLEDLKKESSDKLSYEFIDPDAGGGKLAEKLQSEFGFRPMAIGLLDPRTFWFYMVLESKGQVAQVPLPEELNKAGLERSLKASLKRFSRGMLKTVGLATPAPPMARYGMARGGSKHFSLLKEKLSESYAVKFVDLSSGHVPDDVDLLVMVAPETASPHPPAPGASPPANNNKQIDEKKRFAVDQFLMQGGTVILAVSPFDIDMEKELSCHRHKNLLGAWLEHHGIKLKPTMVMDPQNSSFPIPIPRSIGGLVVHETHIVPYPFFVDVRRSGMDQKSGLIAGLPQVTMNWPSPVEVDSKKSKGKKVIELLRSSDKSWTTESLSIQPDFQKHKELGFKIASPKDRKSRVMALILEGEFESFFKGKKSPLSGADSNEKPGSVAPAISSVIEKSPASSRIILFASNTFLADEMIELGAAGMQSRYLNPVQLIENSIDWSLDDRGLLAIRGRAQFSRTLLPLDKGSQVFWEYLNYGLAAGGLFVVWLLRHNFMARSRKRYSEILGEAE